MRVEGCDWPDWELSADHAFVGGIVGRPGKAGRITAARGDDGTDRKQVLKTDLHAIADIHAQHDGTRALVRPQHHVAAGEIGRAIIRNDIVPQREYHAAGLECSEAIIVKSLIESNNVGINDSGILRIARGRRRIGRGDSQ